MRQKVKTRVKVKGARGMPTSLVPTRSPTMLVFLALGLMAGLAVVYMLVKFLSQMPGTA
jgi:hypothetical protein